MRILHYMFLSMMAILLLVGFSFFITKEVLLNLGTSQLKNAVAQLRDERESGAYKDACVKKGSIFIEGENLVTYQLRFTSKTEYVLEAVCDQFSFDPLEIGSSKLPPFVTKVAGSSGIVLGQNGSGVRVVVFEEFDALLTKWLQKDVPFIDKQSGVYVLDNKTYFAEANTQIIPGPKTTCTGYGYSCCSAISEVGNGDQLEGSTDCDKTCFSQCTARPVLLSFASNPFVDYESKILSISSNTLVDFAYVASHRDKSELLAVLSFGDGESISLQGKEGQVSHTYICKTQQCRYTASITITDAQGVVSVPSQISTIPVVVTQ